MDSSSVGFRSLAAHGDLPPSSDHRALGRWPTTADAQEDCLSFDLVDKMQHHDVEIGEAFGEHLKSELGRTSFHAPDAISDGVRYVVDLTPAKVWDRAARNLTTPADSPWTRDTARARHREVLDRRNRIAHEADLDPATGRRHPMTWQEASDAVTWFDDLGHALHTVIAQR